MAALVGIGTDQRAVLAAQVALKLMDRRCLRSSHDVERNGLIGVATEATDFQIADFPRAPEDPDDRAEGAGRLTTKR